LAGQSAGHGILNCLNHAGYKALLFLLAGLAIHKNESNVLIVGKTASRAHVAGAQVGGPNSGQKPVF